PAASSTLFILIVDDLIIGINHIVLLGRTFAAGRLAAFRLLRRLLLVQLRRQLLHDGGKLLGLLLDFLYVVAFERLLERILRFFRLLHVIGIGLVAQILDCLLDGVDQ